MALPQDFPDFRFVTAHRPNPDVLELRWAMQPHAWPSEDLAFIVFRSNSPAGPWDELGEVEPGRFTFADHDVISPGVSRAYYYVLRVLSKSGQGYRDYRPVKLGHDPDHIALEMVRKKNLYLTVKGGIDVAVFLKKSWGPKCSRCYNHERGQPEDADCPDCFGTGFSGGYLNPVMVPALFNPPERAVVRAGLKFEIHNLYAELANYPQVAPEDVVVDRRMNIRYRIEHVRQAAHKMHTVSQILTLLRVDDGDVIYSLDVPEATHAIYGRSHDLVTRNQPHEVLRASRPQSR